MPRVIIEIVFEWSPWYSWETIAAFKHHPARGPIPARPGVYEIRRQDAGREDERLSIGSSRNLRLRFYAALPNDQGGRQATQKQLLSIRWAVTEDYQALETYLRRQYSRQFGDLPTKFVLQ
jgi:hypothetical protein